jgi:hypothetical protein
MISTLNFLAPSLHPNTLTDITFPLTSSPADPIVRHLAIKHGEHAPVGLIKRVSLASPSNEVRRTTDLAFTSLLKSHNPHPFFDIPQLLASCFR